MSTELAILNGLVEIPVPGEMRSNYDTAKLYVTRFFGGNHRGVSIQLGIYYDSDIDIATIQLDNERAHMLLKALQDGLSHVSFDEMRETTEG